MRKQLLLPIFLFSLIVLGTIVAILYGKGYRFSFDRGKAEIAGTGLLVTTSVPNGASVYINDHLTTATDNTINLAPGEYKVSIKKDGYFSWEKRLKIQEQVVAKAEALLFPTAPKLENITVSGVQNPTIDATQTKVAYTVASQSARKNGIYVLAMAERSFLPLQGGATQIADETTSVEFSQARITWSPAGDEILATIGDETTGQSMYLLKPNTFNQNPTDVTATLPTILANWEKERLAKHQARMATLKPKLRQMIQEHFQILSWAPDEQKILYVASTSATLPLIITPRLLGADTTPEERTLKEQAIYVYDIKEDKNFKVLDPLPQTAASPTPSPAAQLLGLLSPTPTQTLQESLLLQRPVKAPLLWFANSKHLLYVRDKKIVIMEHDGSNVTTVYAGPFTPNYVFPWSNVSKILILTNLENSLILPNLYTIDLQ